MPVEGYRNKRVWQYRFIPQPSPVLDRAWDDDRQWQQSVVERLSRGDAAPGSASLRDWLARDPYYSSGDQGDQGWERAEEKSKNAIRTGAVYLSDEAIARRLPDRQRRKQAWADHLAEVRAYWDRMSEREKAERERDKRRRAAEREKAIAQLEAWKKEQAEQDAKWAAWAKEKEAREAERQADWVQTGEEIAARRQQWQREMDRIVANRWVCSSCGTQAEITVLAPMAVYSLKCRCASRMWEHGALLQFMPKE